jgi:sarcosine oxidase
VTARIELTASPSDPVTLDCQVRPDEIAAVASYPRPRVPTLAGRFIETAARVYANTPDER